MYADKAQRLEVACKGGETYCYTYQQEDNGEEHAEGGDNGIYIQGIRNRIFLLSSLVSSFEECRI